MSLMTRPSTSQAGRGPGARHLGQQAPERVVRGGRGVAVGRRGGRRLAVRAVGPGEGARVDRVGERGDPAERVDRHRGGTRGVGPGGCSEAVAVGGGGGRVTRDRHLGRPAEAVAGDRDRARPVHGGREGRGGVIGVRGRARAAGIVEIGAAGDPARGVVRPGDRGREGRGVGAVGRPGRPPRPLDRRHRRKARPPGPMVLYLQTHTAHRRAHGPRCLLVASRQATGPVSCSRTSGSPPVQASTASMNATPDSLGDGASTGPRDLDCGISKGGVSGDCPAAPPTGLAVR